MSRFITIGGSGQYTGVPVFAVKRLVRQGSPRIALTTANQELAEDSVHEAVASGRAIRVLTVEDEQTREALSLEVETSFASRGVTQVLEAVRRVPRIYLGAEND